MHAVHVVDAEALENVPMARIRVRVRVSVRFRVKVSVRLRVRVKVRMDIGRGINSFSGAKTRNQTARFTCNACCTRSRCGSTGKGSCGEGQG